MAGKNLILASNPARKRRTAAQKAASKRNIKKAQAARKRRAPRKVATRATKRRRNPAASPARSYRRRRNVAGFGFKGIVDRQVMPALIGGGGAVLNDMLVNFVPFIPAQMRTGWLRHLTKAIGAVAISYVGGMFLSKRVAEQMSIGAMTVVGYNVVRDLVTEFVPQVSLGEYLPMGEYLDPGLGYYGAGLNPSAVPGSGFETAGQFTRGSPYMGSGAELEAWPTGSAYEDLQY